MLVADQNIGNGQLAGISTKYQGFQNFFQSIREPCSFLSSVKGRPKRKISFLKVLRSSIIFAFTGPDNALFLFKILQFFRHFFFLTCLFKFKQGNPLHRQFITINQNKILTILERHQSHTSTLTDTHDYL